MSIRRLAGLLLICVLWLGLFNQVSIFSRHLEVYFLDVGQGDAILIRTPEKKNILVDGGPGDAVLAELGQELPPWERKIDLIVLTHPHADHLIGLLDVLDRFEIGMVLWNPVYYPIPEYEEFARQIERLKEDGVYVKMACRSRFFLEGEVELTVLWPDFDCDDVSNEEVSGGAAKRALAKDIEETKEMGWCQEYVSSCGTRFDENINNDSVVLLLKYGDFELLLMGDAEKEVEAELLKTRGEFALVGVDVLKAGHHCSKTASAEEFLRRVGPEAAVCCVGEGNTFGHPHEETLEKFQEMGIVVRRTDEEGRVEMKR